MSEDDETHLPLELTRVIKRRIVWLFSGLLVASILAGVTLYLLRTRAQERYFRSAVLIDVQHDMTALTKQPFAPGPDMLHGPLRGYAATLKDPALLQPVVERLNLVQKLSPPGKLLSTAQAAQQLADLVQVRQLNPRVVEIGAFNTDRQLAVQIANAIASAYVESCVKAAQNLAGGELAEMRKELDAKRKEVTDLWKTANALRNEHAILDPDTEINHVEPTIPSLPDGQEKKAKLNRYVLAKSSYLLRKNLLLPLEDRYAVMQFNAKEQPPAATILESAKPESTDKPSHTLPGDQSAALGTDFTTLLCLLLGLVAGVGITYFLIPDS